MQFNVLSRIIDSRIIDSIKFTFCFVYSVYITESDRLRRIACTKTLNTTPFVLLATYLVAATTRVFFTRLAVKKNPMTADTIHFHHVILQESGSYLASTGSIYFVTLMTALFAAFSFNNQLSNNR